MKTAKRMKRISERKARSLLAKNYGVKNPNEEDIRQVQDSYYDSIRPANVSVQSARHTETE